MLYSILLARSWSFSASRLRMRASQASSRGKATTDLSASKCVRPHLKKTYPGFSILNFENIFSKYYLTKWMIIVN